MSTKFVTGDLFFYPGLRAWAHGCNCSGYMRAGVAVEFRARFPGMYQAYQEVCHKREFKLGSVFSWGARVLPRHPEVAVYNLGTQLTPGPHAELSAIEQSVTLMTKQALDSGVDRIGLPRIGSGLGGLVWRDVKDVLSRIGENTDVELVVFEEYQPIGPLLTSKHLLDLGVDDSEVAKFLCRWGNGMPVFRDTFDPHYWITAWTKLYCAKDEIRTQMKTHQDE
ncbi:MAG: Appr-1-p processing domain protein [Candidatus Gottesmanbacteria bacterium GW2011_GWB1_49_7]|uniref:Appr-1-p processing domain protein n=1 Tax=Candidatus Gottesmanbacteria bacterium GW2011_GWB1_49_7 TaxID=1618448 RepID=A0A0G1W3R7_9BACT|nr:MAG: Appr-1-p processing domain protein [Candidatus Gottesmanbacteria bacterium GW2011_GWB1_49_7]